MDMPVDVFQIHRLSLSIRSFSERTLMDRDVGKKKPVFREHPPDVDFLKVLLEELVLSVIMIPEDQPLLAIQVGKNIFDDLPPATHIDISEMVDLVLRSHDRIPPVDHVLIHMVGVCIRAITI